MGYVCAHKLFSCFKWNNVFIHRVLFSFFLLFWKIHLEVLDWYWKCQRIPGQCCRQDLFPRSSGHTWNISMVSPMWLVCSTVTQDYCTHIHTSSWLKETKQACLYCFQRETKREDTAKALKQDWFCVWIYPTMEIHIFFFLITMYCLGEKPRGEISEDQYWSCQNAAKIRWVEVYHQERWIRTHSPFISELSGQDGWVNLESACTSTDSANTDCVGL